MDTSSSTSDARDPGAGLTLELKAAAEYSAEDRAALAALSAAVYPPEVLATLPGRHVTWARAQWGVLVRAPGGALVSYVALFVRDAKLDAAPVRIGGVGGVKTHPDSEGRGYASAGIRRAMASLDDDHRVDFSLLVCREHLQPFYERLGWTRFSGRLMVEQPAGHVELMAHLIMVRPGLRPAPVDGTIDLLGPPW